jgi:outer membrane protein OmpA-like peptidoglycan-associated protein
VLACALASLLGACGAAPSGGGEDFDRDGVLDAVDRCPRVPEDIDADADEDGCPEGSVGDRDGDGIDDPRDVCPDDAEDADGLDDHDGCPDPDDDRDRIIDACDRCPREAEVDDGLCDEDGCPDRSGVCVDTSRLVIQDRVVFRVHRATMEDGSATILDALAATLRRSPQTERLLVRGHAGMGERRAPILGLARAEATRDALVARGVPADRLAVEGRAQEQDAGWDRRATELLVTRVDGVEREPERALPEPASSTCGPARCEPVVPCVAPRTPSPAC